MTATLKVGSLKLYLAGPMTGIPEWNFPAFRLARTTLRDLGHSVFCPAERDLEAGFDPAGMTGHEDLDEHGFDLREALGADLEFICAEADAVIVLPGWATSSGALAEVATARALGLPVRRLHEFIVHGLDAPHVDEALHESDDWRTGRMVEIGGPDDRYLEDPFALNGDELDVGWVVAQAKLHRGGVVERPDWRDHARKVMAEDPERPTIDLADETGRAERVARAKAQHPSNTLHPAAADGEELVTSATGGSKGRKPLEVGAVDPMARAELGRVAAFGAQKYDRNNYLKGYDWSLCVDALHRHMLAFESGEDRDPESGLLHVVHAAWHGLALASFILRGIGTDDRAPGEVAA